MSFWNVFARRTPNSTPRKEQHPPRPSAAPCRRRSAFQPRTQAESETRAWLSSPGRATLDAILQARDRAARLVATTQLTHAAAETRRWARAPTERNLRRILWRRDCVAAAGVRRGLEDLRCVLLADVVASGDVNDDYSGGKAEEEEEEEWEGETEIAPEWPSRPMAHPGFVVGLDEADRETVVRVVTRDGDEYFVMRTPPRYVTYPSCFSHPDNIQGDSQSREHRTLLPAAPEVRDDAPEMPPRPSCIPGNHSDESIATRCDDGQEGHPADGEEEEEVELEIAVAGRMTCSQRVIAVSTPESIPEEYFTWSLASRASFSNNSDVSSSSWRSRSLSPSNEEQETQEDTEGYEGGDDDVNPAPSLTPPPTPRGHASLRLDEPSPPRADFHLAQVRRALSLPTDTPRRRVEAWILRNPSLLHHIHHRTVPSPGPGAQRLKLVAAGRPPGESVTLEWCIRRVQWEQLDVDWFRKRARVTRGGRRVRRKGARGSRKEHDVDEFVQHREEARTRGMVPSKLRICELAE